MNVLPLAIANRNWVGHIGDRFLFFRTLSLSQSMVCVLLNWKSRIQRPKPINNSHLYYNSTITELLFEHDTCELLFRNFTNMVRLMTFSFVTFLELVIIHGPYLVVLSVVTELHEKKTNRNLFVKRKKSYLHWWPLNFTCLVICPLTFNFWHFAPWIKKY